MMLGYGVDLTVHEIASRLAGNHGCDVDVWTPTSDGTYDGAPYNLREIIVYGTRFNRVLPCLEFNAWRALRGLRRRLAAAGESYDVVVPCTHPYYCAGSVLGVPQVFFNFGNVPTTGFSWKGKLNWAWLDFSERYLHKPWSARVVSISRFLHGQQSDDVQRAGRVVHLGGDHYFPASESKESFRQRHGIPLDAIVLGYCGRLHRDHPPYKGTSVVLELGRRIAAVEPRAQLVLCGIGSPADEEWVRSEGALPLANLPPSEMPGFYAALDVYVCASRWEGFNLPIVEAAWHGAPSVAFDAGAHSEHVTAVLVPDGDSEQLFSKTLELVQDATKRDTLGEQARSRAQLFSWDHTAAQFHDVLREVAQ
jgi:glycosyltransferase involved in cell wall biosynthesis